MTLNTSLYLDVLRFFSAMIVFLGHLSGKRFTNGLFWQLGQYMESAVIVFFVLSGFVIAHVTYKREISAKQYIIARAARIYSVALPALIIVLILDRIGVASAPELYNSNWGYESGMDLYAFLAGLLFVNQLWFLDIRMGSMLPYWSLGYEVWYYIIYGACFVRLGARRIFVILAILMIAGPRIALMFPLWLFGYLTYILCSRVYLFKHIPTIFLHSIFPLSLVSCYLCLIKYDSEFYFYSGFLNLLGMPNLFLNYALGLAVSMNILGFVLLPAFSLSFLNKIKHIIRWFAGATFTIYLLHLSIAQFLLALMPSSIFSVSRDHFIVPITFVALLAIAQFTERRKKSWHDFLNTISLTRHSLQ